MGKIIRRTGWQTTTGTGLLTEVRGAWYDPVAMDSGAGDMLSDDSACGLYVHIPFCRAKCGYCDFFSIAVADQETAPFVTRVCRELEQRVVEGPYRVLTVFYGGGTPTILPTDQLATLLRFPAKLLPPGQVEECTVEANPATVDEERAELLVDSCVTRVYDSRLLPVPTRRNSEGAGWIDYNADGRPDILITNGEHGICLFENTGKNPTRFRDVSAKAGLGPKGIGAGNGDFIVVFDYDADGYADFFYNLGRGLLVRNQCNGSFKPV